MDYVEEQGISIVANGAFNPAIFNPSWLCRHELISAGEEEASTIEIIHPEISQFTVPGIKFDIQTERAALNGLAEPFIRAVEMFSQIFERLLPHTPIDNVGVNYWVHFTAKDWAQRQRFARLFVPIEPWGEFGQLLESDDKNLAGGFSTLSMRAAFPDYGENGSINVHLQPSAKIGGDNGVFAAVNHHFSNFDGENAGGAVLRSYDSCMKYSRTLIKYLIEKARSS